MKPFNINDFDVKKFDAILARGLSSGVGNRDGQMCIEAAICATLDLPHGDNPRCVASSVRSFKIALNDKPWSSPQARSKGLRDLGLAQLGSKGVVDNVEFCKRLSTKLIEKLIPTLFGEVFKPSSAAFKAGQKCKIEPTIKNARAAADVAACAAAYASAACAAAACAYKDTYLILTANSALEVLKELKSPGCALL